MTDEVSKLCTWYGSMPVPECLGCNGYDEECRMYCIDDVEPVGESTGLERLFKPNGNGRK